MEDRLDKVIKKIILPHYPTVMKFKIKKESSREYKYNFTFDRPIYKNVTTYVVEYYFDTYSDLKEYSEGWMMKLIISLICSDLMIMRHWRFFSFIIRNVELENE